MKIRNADLNEFERRFVRRAWAGRGTRFEPGAGASIRAAVIRDVMLRAAERRSTRCRIAIGGARITGVLDLRDGAGPAGGPLPALRLAACIIEKPIRLDNARLRGLSLRRCHLPGIQAKDVRIEGTVDLARVRADQEGGACVLNLRGARIRGSLRAGRALLRCDVRAEDRRDIHAGDVRYALDLGRATIDGRILLQPGFEAAGGVNLGGARVRGEIWAGGALLESGEFDALHAQGLTAGALVVLNPGQTHDGRARPFTARGTMSFTAARIAGQLDMTDARIEAPPPDSGGHGRRNPDLSLTDARLGGGLALSGSSIAGTIYAGDLDVRGDVGMRRVTIGRLILADARISGSLNLDGTLGSDGGDMPPLEANGIRVGGEFRMLGLTSHGPLRLASAVVGGSLTIQTVCGFGDRRWNAMDAPGARVAGFLNLAGVLYGDVNLNHATIERDLVVGAETRVFGAILARSLTARNDVLIGRPTSGASMLLIEGLLLTSAVVGGSVNLWGTYLAGAGGYPAVGAASIEVAGSFVVAATLRAGADLSHAHIATELSFEPATRILGSLYADRLRIDGDVRIKGVLLGRENLFRQAVVGGRFEAEEISLLHSTWESPALITLQDARIQGELCVHDLVSGDPERQPLPDDAGFEAMRRLELSCYPGWSLVEARAPRALIRGVGGFEKVVPEGSGVVGFLWRPARARGRRGDVVLLTGNRNPIVHLNQTGALQLRTPQQADQYLRLFTSYVWGDKGSFRLLGPRDPALEAVLEADAEAGELAAPASPDAELELVSRAGRPDYQGSRTVLYYDGLYRADFSLRLDGAVEMLDDSPAGRIDPTLVERSLPPFRYGGIVAGPGDWPVTLPVDAGWEDLERNELARAESDLRAVLVPPTTRVVLQDARADRLDDGDGTAWSGRLQLQLDGFTYGRAPLASTNTDDWEDRKNRRQEVRNLQRLHAFEDALLGARALRRRPLHSHPGWDVVEALVSLNLDEDGYDLGLERTDPGVIAFLWQPAPPRPDEVPADGLPPTVIGLTGVHVADSGSGVLERLDSLATPATLVVDGDGAPPLPVLRDRLHLFLHANPLDNRRWRLVDAGTPPLAGPDGESVSTFEVTRPDAEPREYRVHCAITDGSRVRVEEYAIAEDGAVRHESAEPLLVVDGTEGPRELGPVRLFGDAAATDADGFPPSAWGSGWAKFGPDDAARALDEYLRILPFIANEPPVRRRTGAEKAAAPDARGSGFAAAARQRIGQALRWFGRTMLGRTDRETNRLRWLDLQYPDGVADRRTYRPHPYEVLAAAFRNEGADKPARRILSRKLKLESDLEPFFLKTWLLGRPFGFFFDYGLSPSRAFLSTVGLLLLGWGATALVNATGMLVVDFTPAATVVVETEPDGGQPAGLLETGSVVEPSDRVRTRVNCGDNISNLVFAADVMLPILDLGQTHRCQIANTRPLDDSGTPQRGFWLSPTFWKFLQSLYAVMGAIVVSLFILTVSGVLRRRAES